MLVAVHINVGQPRTLIVASTLQLDDELLVLKGRRLRIRNKRYGDNM
jgi:hypothetical protein